MLPLDQIWYRRLLALAVPIGLAAGVLALLYTVVTGAGTDLLFESTGSGWWSGEWWWIPLIATGGLLVALLRRGLGVPEDVPGAIAFAHRAWVDPSSGPRLVLVSVVSLIVGASLGPSFGLIVMGGSLGAWVVTRFGTDDEEAKEEYTLTGMAGGLGAAFSSPLFAVLLTTELSPTEKGRYVAAFIPQLIAATLGFVVFGITQSPMLDAYKVAPYTFEYTDLMTGLLLGVFGAITLAVLLVINNVVGYTAGLIDNSLVRGVAGGAVVGLIAFALPVTLSSGSSELKTVIDGVAMWSAGFVGALVVGKMLAVAVSLSSGFLGGNVFPMIFIGGASGVLVHLIFPGIPLSLAVAGMMAAVPGAFLNAPLSLTLIAAATVGLDAAEIVPITVAVATSYLSFAGLRYWLERRSAAAETV